jgi:aspartate carbamoyltransferase catalytic subunit
MKNLFTLSELSNQEIMDILNDAVAFSNGKEFSLSGKIVANLFFEPSTRTEYSFTMAEHLLNIKPLSFNKVSSSFFNKGETFKDTVKCFEAFGVDAFVIRHSENEYYKDLNLNVPLLNAGDGTHAHPTQCLLDLLTIYQEFGKFEGLKVCFVGDVKFSRVAHEGIETMERLGMTCYVSGPNIYMEDDYKFVELDEACKTMDVIILLRVQNERHSEEDKMDQKSYLQMYGMTKERALSMKEGAIIMHPGPFNRGVEIADEVLDLPQTRIFKQMKNGVFVRQAALKRSLE